MQAATFELLEAIWKECSPCSEEFNVVVFHMHVVEVGSAY